ncbi:MAG TPA: FG-GAP repeat protein, partial [Polyangia bacterium]
GVVYLYKGTWEGLVPWMKLQESDWGVNLHDGDGFGSHLLAADIDGDGVTDLLVAAPSAAGIDSARGGAVFHYQGYARGGLVTRAWYDQESTRLGTNENGDLFGSALAAGDFDGDGKLDVAVGAPGETPGSHPKSGYVFLLRGSGFDILVGWQGVDEGALASDVAGDDFGWSVAAGDLDFDGKAELIVGAPGKTNGAGAAFIFRGGASAMQPQAMLTGPGTPAAADAYGKAVAVGAFDGVYIGATRRLELAIGAPGRAGSGRVYLEDVVFDGSLTNVQRIKTIDQSMVGWDNDAGDNFGSVLAVADPNRDLADDLVVGVPAKHARGVDGNGAVELFAGSSSSSWMTGWTAYAQPQDGTLSADDHFGSAVGVGYFRGQIPPGLVAGVSGKHVGGVASGAFVEFAGVNGAAPAFAQTVTEDVQLRQ